MKKFGMLALLGVSLLSAKTYTITVTNSAKAGAAQLKPGDYKVKVDGSQAVLMDRKGHTIATAAKVETSDHKYGETSIASSSADGTNRIESIQLAGTHDKIVFGE